jgi:DNA-directed RNA polymerase subunit RPC12/RpoP
MNESTRCPHLVVDGDKPIAKTGPRCAECKKAWYSNPPAYKGGGNTCPYCGEELHRTYSPGPDGYFPHTWAHEAPRGCPRSEFPVEGYEEKFGFYGWGNWEEHLEYLRNNEKYYNRNLIN